MVKKALNLIPLNYKKIIRKLRLHLTGLEQGSSRICLTWTKWPNYEEGPYKNLKKPQTKFEQKKIKLLFMIH